MKGCSVLELSNFSLTLEAGPGLDHQRSDKPAVASSATPRRRAVAGRGGRGSPCGRAGRQRMLLRRRHMRKAFTMAEEGDSPAASTGPLDAVVIGAGFAGLYMLHRLREQGFSVHGFEQGDGVGGTWYWNRYPGARCDSEIMYYSFSFMEDLEQEWPLEERYPGQPEILRYLEHVADRLDLRKDFTFGARVAAAEYDEAANLWTVRTEQGQTVTARFVITAVGCLSTANKPEFKGSETFGGLSLHTGQWPKDPVDFT